MECYLSCKISIKSFDFLPKFRKLACVEFDLYSSVPRSATNIGLRIGPILIPMTPVSQQNVVPISQTNEYLRSFWQEALS